MGITAVALLQHGLNAEGSRLIYAPRAALSILPQVPVQVWQPLTLIFLSFLLPHFPIADVGKRILLPHMCDLNTNVSKDCKECRSWG